MCNFKKLKMDKLPMCRICLVQNVRMYVVVNKNLHEIYEKLTDIPFVTEDSRPTLACLFCCTKLKQCYQLLRKCLQAEEQFTQMMNEDYEPNPTMNIDHSEFCYGFSTSAIEHISVVDGCLTEKMAIKEEVPAICETQDDVIDPKEEYPSDDLELENLHNTCLGIKDVPPHLSDSDSEGNELLVELASKVEQVVSLKKRGGVVTNRAPVTKKPKLDTRRTRLEDTMTVEGLKKTNHLNLEAIRTIKNFTSKHSPSVKGSSKCDQRRQNADIKKKIRTHTGDKPYKCEVCQRSFSHKGHLITHSRIHTGEKSYKCEVCQHSFSEKSNLTKHIRIHTGEKPYQCEVCQRSFSMKSGLTAHFRTHTGDKPYKCEVCQRSFSHKGNLITHSRIHTGEKSYKCEICQHSFSDKGNLTSHMRIHTGEKPYQCDVCQLSFRVRGTLIRHIRIHTSENPHQCDICQRTFSVKSSLTKHIRIHTGENPHQCDICQSSFSEKGNLTKHIRIHTGENPYQCDICQRSFSEKRSLTAHVRTHTGEKPYQCDVCQRSFRVRCTLIRHIRIHTGDKPNQTSMEKNGQ